MPPTIDSLVALSRSGRHAASDHLETAALVGVPTVGCRRCGGGLAGAVGSSNVARGRARRRRPRSRPRALRRERRGAASDRRRSHRRRRRRTSGSGSCRRVPEHLPAPARRRRRGDDGRGGLGLGDGSRPCGRVRSPGHAGDRNDAAATPGCRHRGALCCLLLRGSTGRARTAARAPRSGVRRQHRPRVREPRESSPLCTRSSSASALTSSWWS